MERRGAGVAGSGRHLWVPLESTVWNRATRMSDSIDILDGIGKVIEDRKQKSADESYVATLFAGGIDTILKKIGEEAAETVIAGKDGKPDRIVYEVADLWFHSLILLAHYDLAPADVLKELERRFGRSGLDEKAARAPSPG